MFYPLTFHSSDPTLPKCHNMPYNDYYDVAIQSVEFQHAYGSQLEVTLKGMLCQRTDKHASKSMFDEISRVEVSGPCTIVYFSDGSKEIVRRTESDSDNLEIAILYAVAKHCYGTNSKMHKHLYKLIDEALDRQEAREVTHQIRAEKKAKKKAENNKKRRS